MDEKFIKEFKELGNPYEIMNLEYNCSRLEIKVAFNSLSRKYHPDKNPDNPKARTLYHIN